MFKEEKNKFNSIKNQMNAKESCYYFPKLYSNLFIKPHVFNASGDLPNYVWLKTVSTFFSNLKISLSCINDAFELASFNVRVRKIVLQKFSIDCVSKI